MNSFGLGEDFRLPNFVPATALLLALLLSTELTQIFKSWWPAEQLTLFACLEGVPVHLAWPGRGHQPVDFVPDKVQLPNLGCLSAGHGSEGLQQNKDFLSKKARHIPDCRECQEGSVDPPGFHKSKLFGKPNA